MLVSLAVLGVTAGAQVAVFAVSGSVALLADLIHNFGDASTAVPLGIAFAIRSSSREGCGARGGRRLDSPALIADGNHARVDGFVSLGVVATAVVAALGAPIGDPLIGLGITLVVLELTWTSWKTVPTSDDDRHH